MRYLVLAAVLLTGVGLFSRPKTPTPAQDEAGADETGVSTTQSSARGIAIPSRPAGGGFESGLFVDVQEQRYAVQGRTANEILSSMRASGPSTGGKSFFGLTASEFSFQIQPRMDGASCVVDEVRVELAVTITLPEWTPPETAPYELQRDWSRFSTALKRHEDQHRQLAADGAAETLAALQGLRRASCQEIEFEARQRAERIAEQIEAKHHRYDDETDHGRTEGAVWPLP
ncbi:MAG: DUF922 domain-containing protein [Bacteroidota bacterium]